MRNPLQVQERSKILKLRAQGMSILAISKEMHRSRNTVSTFIKDPINYVKSLPSAKPSGNTPKNGSVPYKKLSSKDKTPKKKLAASSTTNSDKKSTKVSTDKKSSHKTVEFEHRAVIKFLTKKGWNAVAIHDDMKHVYEKSTPSLPDIEFWVQKIQSNPSIKFDRSQIPKSKKEITERFWKLAVKKKSGEDKIKKTNKDKEKKSPSNKSFLTFKLFDDKSKNGKSNVAEPENP